MLKEDPDERRMFNSDAKLHGGPLQFIALTLEIWGKTHHTGSFGAQCFIMANEVRRVLEQEGASEALGEPKASEHLSPNAREEALEIVQWIDAVDGEEFKVTFEDEEAAACIGTVLENAGKVARAYLALLSTSSGE